MEVSTSRLTQADQAMQDNQVQTSQWTTMTSMEDISQKDSDIDQPLLRLHDNNYRPITPFDFL